MKRTRIFLSAIAVVALVGCNNNGTTTSEVADSTQTAVEADTVAVQSVVIELGAENDLVPETNPIVIDFNATWCGPCKQFAPIYHKVAEEYAEKAVFAAADVDICKALADKHQIANIPTVAIIYPGDKAPVYQVGSMSEEEFKAFLDKNL